MRPWKVGVGLTAVFAGLGLFYVGIRFDYLAPYSRLLAAEHWGMLAYYALGSLLVLSLVLAVPLRSLGLHDVGRKVDLVERSMRRGEGDPELAHRLREEEQGTFSE